MKSSHFTLSAQGEIRTRFAPSPTGFLHIGSARTALFNYLFAKKQNGRFILRIEDTDKERSSPEFENDILDSLKWLGIEWDEGPVGGNPKYIGGYGPYRQSERRGTYKKYIEKLLAEKKAYYCFCSEEELDTKRQERQSRGLAPLYNGKCEKLSKSEVKKNLSSGKSYIIRFKTPSKKIKFRDVVRKEVEFDAGLLGDFAIAKGLDTPLYNLAVVIDDFEMKISHIIRGEDLLPNTPKQIMIQEALSLPVPEYGHLPLILGPDKSKLSKRHGAVSLFAYKEQGYLPESIINFLAFLGWNPGTEKEIYSLPALIKDFSIEKVQKGGAIFNIKKLDFINGFYIRKKPLKKLTELCLPYLVKSGFISPVFGEKERFQNLTGYFGKEIVQNYKIGDTEEIVGFDFLEAVVGAHQERLKKLSEIIELSDYFFKDKIKYEKNIFCWKNTKEKELPVVFDRLVKILSEIKDGKWTVKNLEDVLIKEAETFAKDGDKPGDRGYLLWPLRAALSGKKHSASPFEIAAILGKDKTLKRIGDARNSITQ